MPFIRLPVTQAGGAIKYVPPYLASNRIYVKDFAGTYHAIVNVPDAVPPAGEFPVRKQDNSQVTIPFFFISEAPGPFLVETPGVTIISPAAGLPPFNVGDSVTLEASCTLNGIPASPANISWSSDKDGPLYIGASTTITNLSVNTHVITASFTNGTTATDSETVTVDNPVPASAPTVTILSPENDDSYFVGSSVKFNATAVDTDDGPLSDSIKWYSSTTSKVLYTGSTFTLNTLPPGTHKIRATCQDNDPQPNEGEDSITLTIVSNTPDVTQLALEGQVVISRQAYGSGVVQ